MATTKDFMDYVNDQIQKLGEITNKKMFGEYMLYYKQKPILLICDNTVYVKQIQAALEIFENYNIEPNVGTPYDGAKPHYVLDVEDPDLAIDMIKALYDVLPMPKPKVKKKT